MEMSIQVSKTETAEFFGFSATTLKTIAVIAMLIQHFTVQFTDSQFSGYFFLTTLGKITAPVMCYFVAEGVYFTHDRLKHLKRLLVCAVLSHVPHALAFGFPVLQFWKYTSVMWSLALGLAALMIYYDSRLSRWIKILGILVCCILSYPGNWNCVAVIWILGFGIFRDDPAKKWGVFFLGIVVNILEYIVIDNDCLLISNVGFILPFLLLHTYNGERGLNNQYLQLTFYWLYPLHLLVIYFIKVFLI